MTEKAQTTEKNTKSYTTVLEDNLQLKHLAFLPSLTYAHHYLKLIRVIGMGSARSTECPSKQLRAAMY